MKLHHIALAVTDINTSRDWYAINFGFEEIHRYDKNGKTFCMIEKNGLRLELIKKDDLEDIPEDTSNLPRWMRHYCIEVDNLEESYTTLTANNVTVEKEITEAGFGGRYFFISDHDGYMIEVWSAK